MDTLLPESDLLQTPPTSETPQALTSLVSVLKQVSEKKQHEDMVEILLSLYPDKYYFVDQPVDQLIVKEILIPLGFDDFTRIEDASGVTVVPFIPDCKVKDLPLGTTFPEEISPSFVATTLSRRNHYFVLPTKGAFYYFRCSSRDDGNVFRLTEPPPYLEEALYIMDKELYHVTHADMLKGIVRKSRRLTKLRKSTISYADVENGLLSGTSQPSSGSNTAPASALPKFPSAPDAGGLVPDSGDEELQAANLALSEQVRTLLGVHGEEEIVWEVAHDTQPGQPAQTGAIPNAEQAAQQRTDA